MLGCFNSGESLAARNYQLQLIGGLAPVRGLAWGVQTDWKEPSTNMG